MARPKPRTPYHDQPDAAFWRKAVTALPGAEVDPVFDWTLTIDRDTRIATAGSCFAQHIAKRLSASGFNYLVTEPAPAAISPEIARKFNFGLFTARFGNIYTSRQLLQLIQRAYGRFTPAEDRWIEPDGTIIDPFRPAVQEGGFLTAAEFEQSRDQHLAAVRRMFEELDVFVFTLGLTECWMSREDGAAYPLCPGVSGGAFDPERHAFHNLTVDEIVADMSAFFAILREVNPDSRVILTVSPVPLIATAEPAHVLTATTYSKSVLRVAAETLKRTETEVHYFPSYEVITGAHSRGGYLAEDLREVEEAGVNHVMRLFFRHAAPDVDMGKAAKAKAAKKAKKPAGPSMKELRKVVNVICDESAIERSVG